MKKCHYRICVRWWHFSAACERVEYRHFFYPGMYCHLTWKRILPWLEKSTTDDFIIRFRPLMPSFSGRGTCRCGWPIALAHNSTGFGVLYRKSPNPIIQKLHLLLGVEPMLSVFHHGERCIPSFCKFSYCCIGSQVVVLPI